MNSPRRDLFGDIAVEKRFLTWAQVRDILKRQVKYKDMGISIRIGEVAIEMRLLTQAQCNEILSAQREKRKDQAPRHATAATAFADPDDEGPISLGRYRLEKRLGGVMGMVYRGVDTQSNQTVAVKVLPKTLAHDPAFVERFKREVRATSALSHPNIVRLYDAGVEEGAFFLATEFIDGETLGNQLQRKGRMSETESLQIGRGVACALAHAHAKNVLHRDIKPDNIMISNTGDVKVADFGLAKILDDEQRITADGIAVGTPHYISPEQARALKDTDHRSDLYSLGATLFHIMAGRLPYEGDNGAEVMKRHVFEETPNIRKVAPDISTPAADLLLKLMAKSPGQRFQSADELVVAIDALLANATPAAASPTVDPSAPAAPPATSAPDAARPAIPRKRFGE